MQFPEGFGELGNKTFEEVFDTLPKWIECCRVTWTGNCAGVFAEFQTFVRQKLANPMHRKRHEQRCREFVKSYSGVIPEYLVNYAEAVC